MSYRLMIIIISPVPTKDSSVQWLGYGLINVLLPKGAETHVFIFATR